MSSRARESADAVLGRLLEHDYGGERRAHVTDVGRGASPRRAEGGPGAGRVAAHEGAVAVHDGGAEVLDPEVRLRGLARPGGGGEGDGTALVVNERGVHEQGVAKRHDGQQRQHEHVEDRALPGVRAPDDRGPGPLEAQERRGGLKALVLVPAEKSVAVVGDL